MPPNEQCVPANNTPKRALHLCLVLFPQIYQYGIILQIVSLFFNASMWCLNVNKMPFAQGGPWHAAAHRCTLFLKTVAPRHADLAKPMRLPAGIL